MKIKPLFGWLHRGRGAQSARRQRGAAMVEFALVAPLLFLLIMAIMDLSMLLWVNLTMQHAVREAGRYALTMRNDGYTSAGARQMQVVQVIKENSMGMYDQLKPHIKITLNGTPHDYGGADASGFSSDMFGSSGDMAVMQLDCTWRLMTPLMRPFFSGGEYKFSVATVFNNE